MKNNNLLNYFSMQVNLYFDNRLNKDSEENLMDAVNNDSVCNRVFQSEKQFRQMIKTKAKRTSASEELIKSIKSKLD